MTFLKSLVLCLLLILVSPHTFCQEGVADLKQKWDTYQRNTLQENLYVHTDKSTYLAGEIIWFKIYNVDAQNKAQDVSKVAYVDILDQSQKAVAQLKVALKEGSGSGSVFLPLGTTTGNYTLRAYTNWMKNFDATQFFQKSIVVINTLKGLETPTDTTSITIVRFFPEGGNLVNGLESIVAVQVLGEDGKGIAYHGTITNEKGDSVASFQSLQFGMGRFTFTPEAAHTYQAALTLPSGAVVKKELPQVYAKGYVMQLHRNSNGKLGIAVSLSNDLRDGTVYLMASNHQQLTAAMAKPVASGKANFEIDTASIKEGVTCFTVFNEARQAVCERLYFKKPIASPSLQLTSDQAQYGSRKKVELTLHTTTGIDTTAPVDLSLTVYKKSLLQDSGSTSVYTYLWLTSELSGRVEAPDYYFSTDANIAEAADNLMLTHGWRRFRWEQVVNTARSRFSFPPEVNGHLVKALVTDVRTNKPAPGVYTYLSVPGSPFQFYASKTDSSGTALFDVKNQYGPGELIFQTNTEYDSAYHVELLPNYAQRVVPDSLPAYTFSKAHADALLQQSIGMQVQNIYYKDSLARFSPPAAYDTIPFYGKPDYSYPLDVYTRFQTMEEVLREYVRPINVVQRRGGLHLLILDEARRNFFDGGELVLLDGIPLFNKDKIFAYDPLKVRKLDVVTRKFFIGPNFFNGIASFTTYNGNYEGLQLDPHAVIIDYEGLQLEREFYAPVYETQQQLQSRLPDYRSTLLWQPKIAVKGGSATLSFYTSDVKGSYFVEVQGLDKQGHALVSQLPIEVK